MNHKRSTCSLLAVSLSFAFAGGAQACGERSEQWYVDVSDVVFDATAVCEPERRSCRLRVTNVLKNPESLNIERRPFDVDYQDWFDDYYAANPDTIVLACGVPVFEPEQENFRARFYGNLDEQTSELIIRRADIRDPRSTPEEMAN